jgi:Fic family protein
MEIKQLLNQIDREQTRIDAYGKLDEDTLKRIQYRFRLDWNYHSNAMEGSTLTQQETRSVMINNVDVGGRPIKDINEMRGHDDVVKNIFSMGKGELRLSEKRIKDVHAAIIHEDDLNEKKKIGKWKSGNNEIINYRGEKFVFADHNDVPEEMHELLNWLNAQIDKLNKDDKNALHPALIAFEFHLRFITIHPFYDGNGRTSRIFMNLILISFGYPPVVIKVEEKNKYNRYLADVQAYGGNPDLLYEFLCELLIRSQQLVFDAIIGKDISQPDDLDKKIELLKAEIAEVDKDNEVQLRFDKNVFNGIYDTWLSDLMKKTIVQIRKFDDLFADPSHHIIIKTGEHKGFGGHSVAVNFNNKNEQEIIDELKTELFKKNAIISADTEVTIGAVYGTFKKGALKMPFGCNYNVEIFFEYLKYEVFISQFYPGSSFVISKELKEHLSSNENYSHVYIDDAGNIYSGGKTEDDEKIEIQGKKIIANFSREDILEGKVRDGGMIRFREPRLLHKPFSEDEISELVNKFGNTIFEHIDYWTKKQGIR